MTATDRPESFADVLGLLRQAARGDFDGSTGMVSESFADVLGLLRQAARGDFDGSTGMVSENFMILMGRGLGDSWCAAFQEYADRLQAAHERELENALDAHALQAAIENDDDKRYSMQKVLEIIERNIAKSGGRMI